MRLSPLTRSYWMTAYLPARHHVSLLTWHQLAACPLAWRRRRGRAFPVTRHRWLAYLFAPANGNFLHFLAALPAPLPPLVLFPDWK